jgi:hypothetical protein
MDPSMIQSILGGANNPQDDRLKRRQMQIDTMRKQAMQGVQEPGQMVSGHYVPNYAGMIGGALSGAMIPGQQAALDADMDANHQRQTDTRSKYLDALMMAMRKQYPQQSGPMMPLDGMEDR